MTRITAESQTKERQLELVIAAQAGDQQAKDELIFICMPIAISQVRRINFKHFGGGSHGMYPDAYDDLRQEAFLGLVEAIDLFDTESDVKFWTYAFYRVRKRISWWLAQNAGSVSMPYEAWRTALKVDKHEEREKRELTATELTELTGKGYARNAADARLSSSGLEPWHGVQPAVDDITLDELMIDLVYEAAELSPYHAEYVIKEFVREYELNPKIVSRVHKAAIEVANANSDRPRADERRSVANRRRTPKPRNRRG